MKAKYDTHQPTYTQLEGSTTLYQLAKEMLVGIAFVPIVLSLNIKDRISFKKHKLEQKV